MIFLFNDKMGGEIEIIFSGKINMKIAVDIDNTITAYPSFFKIFTRAMKTAGSEIYIITDREPGTEEKVRKELQEIGIHFDHIIITGNKADYIISEKIEVMVDDNDGYILSLPKNILVLKVREEGNFDFERGKFIYSDRTGRRI